MLSLIATSTVVVWLLIQFGLITQVQAKPYEAYPVSKQLPPVGRVDEQFTFTISNDTYKSTVDKTTQIKYNAYNLPTWLSFDSGSRTFSGTPPSSFIDGTTNNIQYFNFILEGTDTSDSSSLNETYSLVVTATSSIAVADNFNLIALLKNYGNTNGKDALILTPNEIFNVTFDRSSFTNEQQITSYYGRTAEYNAPLPSWLFFDSNTLKFSGTAPTVNSAIAPEAFFEFTLIATDIDGFSGVEIPFQLVIGAHQLTTSVQNTILINVTESGSFTYPLPLNYVYFDGYDITSTNLASMVLQDAPSWVTLNNDTLSGTIDNQTTSSNFSVAIYDNYGDVVYLNFEVLSTKDLFATGSLPNINATRGEWFQYNFLPSQFTSYENTTVSIIYPNSTESHDWLNFQSSNLTMYGNVPNDFQSLNVGLHAELDSQSQELDFQIIGMSKVLQNTTHHNYTNTTTLHSSSSSSTSFVSSTQTSHSSTSISSTSTSSTSSASSTPMTNQNKSHSTNKKTVAIACGVVIPVVVVGALLILLFVLWRHRRSGNNKNNSNPDSDLEKKGVPPNGTDPKSPGTITAMHNPFLGDDESQSGSDLSSIREEKMDHHTTNDLSSGNNMFESQSRENLLADQPDETNNRKSSAFFNPYDRSSSFYMDAEPANGKSWRYSSNGMANNNRQSSATLNTVTTADLFNTSIKEDEPMKKDPRKSSLGLRDSVFGIGSEPITTNRNTLSPLTERTITTTEINSESGIPNSKSFGSESNSSNDDFVPIKRGDDYKWVHSNEPNRKPSKKRFVNLMSEGNVNIGQANDIEGQVPEMI